MPSRLAAERLAAARGRNRRLAAAQEARDAAKLRLKAQIEHTIGLVDHHLSARPQVDNALVRPLQDAAWRADEHVAPLRKFASLRAHVGAAGRKHHAQPRVRR